MTRNFLKSSGHYKVNFNFSSKIMVLSAKFATTQPRFCLVDDLNAVGFAPTVLGKLRRS